MTRTRDVKTQVPHEPRQIPRKVAYDIDEAADLLSLDRSTMVLLLRLGKIQGKKVFAHTIISAAELERFANAPEPVLKGWEDQEAGTKAGSGKTRGKQAPDDAMTDPKNFEIQQDGACLTKGKAFQTFQFKNMFCLRPKEFSEAYGVSRQTLANWRIHKSDGPIFIKEGSLVLYPIEANFERLRNLPHFRSTADDGSSHRVGANGRI